MEKKKEYFTSTDQKFYYMMLDRLIQDTKYFINNNGKVSMWAKSVEEQKNALYECYNKLIEKPLWCSLAQLECLIIQMEKI